MQKQGSAARLAAVAAVVWTIIGAGCSGYPQEQQDRDLLWGFRKLFADTWNQNIAGTTTRSPDVTVTGAGGGTLHVTGQIDADGKTHTLTFTFDHFDFTATSSAVLTVESLTGELEATGVIDQAETLTATDLTIAGTLARDGYDTVRLDGPLTLSSTYGATSGSGSVDGRPAVTWSSGGSSGGATCDDYPIACGTVVNGIEVVGGVVPQSCPCPAGTSQAGADTVTAGGPYWICSCDGT